MQNRERRSYCQRQHPQSHTLRPRALDQYIGQSALVERIRIALDASRARDEPIDHVLLHGPPGLGKTTLAHVIAAEMGSRAYVTSGPALTKAGDLVGTLTRMQPRDVLFIDEIHRLPASVEEYIYPAKKYLMVRTLHKPFSYIVPAQGFPPNELICK